MCVCASLSLSLSHSLSERSKRRIFVFCAPNKDQKSVGKQEEEDELELIPTSGSFHIVKKIKNTKKKITWI